MPRYKEIPNVGLYLEQTVKYINECLAPIEISITPSMLSNYVKKGYIDRPIKKQYYADQIAYAIYIYSQQILTKTIASLCFDIKNSRRYTNKNKASFVQHKNITLEPQKLLLKNLRIKTTKLWTKPISFKILKRLTTAM